MAAFEFVYTGAEANPEVYESYSDEAILAQWEQVIPRENILILSEPKGIVDAMLGTGLPYANSVLGDLGTPTELYTHIPELPLGTPQEAERHYEARWRVTLTEQATGQAAAQGFAAVLRHNLTLNPGEFTPERPATGQRDERTRSRGVVDRLGEAGRTTTRARHTRTPRPKR